MLGHGCFRLKGSASSIQPRTAASIAAKSIFFIVIIAANARLAAARSGLVNAFVNALGVTSRVAHVDVEPCKTESRKTTVAAPELPSLMRTGQDYSQFAGAFPVRTYVDAGISDEQGKPERSGRGAEPSPAPGAFAFRLPLHALRGTDSLDWL